MPTHVVFGTVKYIANALHRTKKQVHGWCVGEDMANIILANRTKFFEFLITGGLLYSIVNGNLLNNLFHSPRGS